MVADALGLSVVDEATAERLRQAIERDEPSSAEHFAQVKQDAQLAQVHAQATNAAKLANQIKENNTPADRAETAHTKELGKEIAAEAAAEAKHFTAEAKAHGAEIYAEGKDMAGQAKGKAAELEKKGAKALSAAEKKAAELEKRAAAEARELKKKADKAARAAARELRSHPFATSGVVGVINFALLAGTGYLAYTNWSRPHWDRKVVAGVASAWAVLGGLQVAGYEEVFAQ